MPYQILIHVAGEEAIAGEVDELPKSTDTIVTFTNPRRREGKEIHYVDSRAVKIIWPMDKISFIEVLGDGDADQIVSFVRE